MCVFVYMCIDSDYACCARAIGENTIGACHERISPAYLHICVKLWPTNRQCSPSSRSGLIVELWICIATLALHWGRARNTERRAYTQKTTRGL